MTSAGISDEEFKEKLLRLLEEDRELRHALMGLLGFKEILERITRLEERFVRLEERQQKLEERQLRLEEEFKKLEERFARLEERFAKLEERFAVLEERYQKLEERVIRLEERVAKLEERMINVEKELAELRKVSITIAHRFGVLSEEAFRQAMKYVVEDVLKVARVEKWVHRDEEGFVYGYPAIVEVDVAIKDNVHILVEIKSRVSKADVSELYRIGKLYEKVEKVKPRLVIVGGFIDPDASDLAKRLGVEIVPVIT